jgi:hypothetical protein
MVFSSQGRNVNGGFNPRSLAWFRCCLEISLVARQSDPFVKCIFLYSFGQKSREAARSRLPLDDHWNSVAFESFGSLAH